VAILTEGQSGADLENIVNLAALQSVRRAVKAKAFNSKLEGKELIEFTTSHVDTQKQ
jgi:SpoVK/Ycf46/Vps4 family AAA+-type ATPase